jgi:hypothetical protein
MSDGGSSYRDKNPTLQVFLAARVSGPLNPRKLEVQAPRQIGGSESLDITEKNLYKLLTLATAKFDLTEQAIGTRIAGSSSGKSYGQSHRGPERGCGIRALCVPYEIRFAA